MDRKKIEKKFFALVQSVLPPDARRPPVSRETRLLDDPSIDSLTMASLGALISDEFAITTDDIVAMMPKFATAGDALDLVAERVDG